MSEGEGKQLGTGVTPDATKAQDRVAKEKEPFNYLVKTVLWHFIQRFKRELPLQAEDWKDFAERVKDEKEARYLHRSLARLDRATEMLLVGSVNEEVCRRIVAEMDKAVSTADKWELFQRLFAEGDAGYFDHFGNKPLSYESRDEVDIMKEDGKWPPTRE